VPCVSRWAKRPVIATIMPSAANLSSQPSGEPLPACRSSQCVHTQPAPPENPAATPPTFPTDPRSLTRLNSVPRAACPVKPIPPTGNRTECGDRPVPKSVRAHRAHLAPQSRSAPASRAHHASGPHDSPLVRTPPVESPLGPARVHRRPRRRVVVADGAGSASRRQGR
jgi:hypothetical protein